MSEQQQTLIPPLVDAQWLAERLGTPDIAILDASAHLPDANRDARAEFEAAHIPGARYLDLKTLVDESSAVPSAFPTRIQFDRRMGLLGVGGDAAIVLYDDSDLRSAARAWAICRFYGLENVAILDGGLAGWRAAGHATQSGGAAIEPTAFASAGGAGAVRDKQEMLANIDSGREQVLDARDAPRFRGEAPDIRPGVPAGHIPRSRNLFFRKVLNDDGTFRDPEAIRGELAAAGVEDDRPVVTTCGSGMTASVLLFALHLTGRDDTALYDGSWAEWGADPDTPKAIGAPS
ncbi:sulfurtransferase [Aurantiacibacter spongiae]|uniref:Sulfurtransferase n=1 Tax=Aurantiacibacter spongiae TaxID=2488860 RepID=A0A3N5DSB1_9SPHN|nr:sulfurtransferase [Aurantiacibacter spongiae]RPF72081.1 sulfurtransferase [Aurantiacibacter spongiae]